MKNKKSICIIPARSGSRRIKNKNIINFFGKPIISYAITAAIKSKLFDKIIVSTDSKKISKISISYGATVPSLRPRKLSNTKSTINEVMKYCVQKYNLKNYRYLFCIFPSSPLLVAKDLINAQKKIIKEKAAHLISVRKSNELKQKIFFKRKKLLLIKNHNKRTFSNKNEFYIDNGNFFILDVKKYISGFKKDYKDTIGYEMINKEANDINTFDDLNFLKFLFKK
jgi:CMP-N-acetylneuraminic acid synthetase